MVLGKRIESMCLVLHGRASAQGGARREDNKGVITPRSTHPPHSTALEVTVQAQG